MASFIKNPLLLKLCRPVPFTLLSIVFAVAWFLWVPNILKIFDIKPTVLTIAVPPLILIFITSNAFLNTQKPLVIRFLYSIVITLIVIASQYLVFGILLAVACMLPPHSCL